MQRRNINSLMLLIGLAPAIVGAAPLPNETIIDTAHPAVVVVHSDSGSFGGMTTGVSHMVSPAYRVRKRIDLSAVPPAVWDQALQVRLSIWMLKLDYSFRKQKDGKYNGFTESFVIKINGKPFEYPTATPLVQTTQIADAGSAWYDFDIPMTALKRGVNEIIIHKLPSQTEDDFVYVGIDNSIPNRGFSDVTYDGEKTWRNDQLTKTAGNGEYMVRVVFVRKQLKLTASWSPSTGVRNDPDNLLIYTGPIDDGVIVELDHHQFAQAKPVTASVRMSQGKATEQWLDDRRQPITGKPVRPLALKVTGVKPEAIESIQITGEGGYRPVIRPPDMAPRISAPAGAAAKVEPSCNVTEKAIVFDGPHLRARFSTDGKLQLVSLLNRHIDREMVTDPAASRLFLVEIGDKRYGADDFTIDYLHRLNGAIGVAARLVGPQGLHAYVTLQIDGEGQLVMTGDFRNEGDKALDFKVAFPHLGGLTLSDKPANDHYLFPWGGGIIADTPAYLRRGYGDYEAIWQMIDLFSPSRGGGLSVRIDDREGMHKIMVLRNVVAGTAEFDGDRANVRTKPKYLWKKSLDATPGMNLTVEYLRRTRLPGEAFAPSPAVIMAHPGDWHVAMQAYSDWARRVWTFRPFPHKLADCINTVPPGWGQDPLVKSKDGAYRDDFMAPHRDCAELMSWWEWSKLGPWQTEWDKLRERIGDWAYNRFKAYWVKDAVTGELMYPLNRGDYDGYNPRWGGLPALRRAIQRYQDAGMLVMLYTDPILADDNTKLAANHGKAWCVVDHLDRRVENYLSWNMCHDNPRYREYVRDTMRRVMIDTGADGIRLDEYGHQGWACFSDEHEHTWSEKGCSQWLKGIAETTRMVRQAMDEVAPGSVLTTEFPGNDYMMQFLEGSITYDLHKQAVLLRPLECDILRFYLPEHQTMELDVQNKDPHHRKALWNGKISFQTREYVEPMYSLLKQNRDVFNSRDIEPLVPTSMPRVYANRFTGGGKTLVTLYHGGRYTVEGELFRMPVGADEHVIDPLTVQSLDNRVHDGELVLSGRMIPDDLRVVMRLPKLMTVRADGEVLQVGLPKPPPPGAVLVVTDTQAAVFATQPAQIGEQSIKLPADAGGRLLVKLMADGQWVDARPVAARQH